MKKFVYADNAATTPVSQHVLDSMLSFLSEHYGNPSSVYDISSVTKNAIEESRKKVALALGCEPQEVFFTSCGTESDNWAIKGAAFSPKNKNKNHIITSAIEHHAVLHSCEHLKKFGYEITYLPVDKNGFVNPVDVKNAITDKTALVSIMYANNEIGTIEPISQIGAICRDKGVLFHTDAVQAVGNVRIDVKAQSIDMLSLSGHKLNAPKGVGVLYVRRGVVLDTFMDGGAQESGKRAGTENVAGIVALGTAIEDAYAHFDEKVAKQRQIRDYVMERLLNIERVRLNGDKNVRLAGNLNVSVEGIEGESLLLLLNMNGIAASSGSACTSGALDPSHVLLAIGLPHEIAHGSLRLTFGPQNTMDDAEYICEKLPEIIGRLRAMSPVWERIKKEEI
ncbi:MAG: cysteine desulfurase NifS [Oscillospiraceae bacterium]